jgi:hypothetical protein
VLEAEAHDQVEPQPTSHAPAAVGRRRIWRARTSKPRKSSAVTSLGKGYAEATRPGRSRLSSPSHGGETRLWPLALLLVYELEGSTPSASASLRMVEKCGSVIRFVSMLISVLWEIPAALASCPRVMRFLRLITLTLPPKVAAYGALRGTRDPPPPGFRLVRRRSSSASRSTASCVVPPTAKRATIVPSGRRRAGASGSADKSRR